MAFHERDAVVLDVEKLVVLPSELMPDLLSEWQTFLMGVPSTFGRHFCATRAIGVAERLTQMQGARS